MNELLMGLGKKLGERFVTNDLSSLLSIKRELERDEDFTFDEEGEISLEIPQEHLSDVDWIVKYPKDRNVRKWSILLVLNLIYSVPFARKVFFFNLNFL
jgi:hypothetical protein